MSYISTCLAEYANEGFDNDSRAYPTVVDVYLCPHREYTTARLPATVGARCQVSSIFYVQNSIPAVCGVVRLRTILRRSIWHITHLQILL